MSDYEKLTVMLAQPDDDGDIYLQESIVRDLLAVVAKAKALMLKVESDDYVNETKEYEALRSALAKLS